MWKNQENILKIFMEIKLYNTFLLHDINNNRINNQIMNNETLVNVSYYTSLVLCSICNILCKSKTIIDENYDSLFRQSDY